MRAHTHPHLYNSKLKGNTFHIWTKFYVVVGTRSMCKVSKKTKEAIEKISKEKRANAAVIMPKGINIDIWIVVSDKIFTDEP